MIRCAAQGNPAPQFEPWSREDRKPLGKRFEQLPNGSLHINPVKWPRDSGTYTCTIRQARGEGGSMRKPQTIDLSVIGEYSKGKNRTG